MNNERMNIEQQARCFAGEYAKKSNIVNPNEKALHTYHTAEGLPIYWRVRIKDTDTGDKWIRPFFYDDGAFKVGEPPKPEAGKPLYNLHLLRIAPNALVWIVEGEKAADALNKKFKQWNEDLNNTAITSGGSTSAGAANWQPLTDRRVVIWADNDEHGAQYAANVIDILDVLKTPYFILDIDSMNLPPKGDAVDWLLIDGNHYDALMLILDRSRHAISNEQQADAITVSQESDAQIIDRLAELSPLEYDRVRTKNAELLGVRATVLDAQIRRARKEISTAGISIEDIEPWHEAIIPDQLLSELSDTVKRFIVCHSTTADTVALWAAMTWFIDVIQVAPLAVITAPEKRCGKSQLLFLLGKLCCRPITASNISPAALFRTIDAWKPTLLIDEADAFMKENEELRGLLNCGHTRDSAYTVRIVGESMTPTKFDVWGAKALAGIGHLADTLMDRSVTLELRRKLAHESVDKLRHAETNLFNTLSAKLARFAIDYREAVRTARPDLPQNINDRAQDNWEPLFAIAGTAGDAWIERTNHAALKLSGSESATISTGTELLADIQEVFEIKHCEKISTANLITALCEDEEKPWSTWNRGKQLSPRQLSARLIEYGIRSKTIRVGLATAKGFEIVQFTDAFNRYILHQESTTQPPQSSENGQMLPIYPSQNNAVTQKETPNSLISKECYLLDKMLPFVASGRKCDYEEVEL